MIRSIRKFENFHIICWLFKDTCWVLDLRVLGLIMIVPTLSLALFITYKFRGLTTELYHNLAVCFWIVANTIWMIGEFFYNDTLRPYAMVFFISGLSVLIFYYLFIHKRLSSTQEGNS